MGYERHHAIIVTSWDQKLLQEAHDMACNLFHTIAEITPQSINGFASFLIAPDGSKEDWKHSNLGNEARDNFIHWIKSKNCIDYVEIQYGDDENVTKLLRHSR